jgi:hypothetical protein
MMKRFLFSILTVAVWAMSNSVSWAQTTNCPVSLNAVMVSVDASQECNSLISWQRNTWQAFYHVYITVAATNTAVTDLVTDSDSLYIRDFGDSLFTGGLVYRATVHLVDAVSHQDIPSFSLQSAPFSFAATGNLWCPVDTSQTVHRNAPGAGNLLTTNGVIENNVFTRVAATTSCGATGGLTLGSLQATGLATLSANTPINIIWLNRNGQALTPSIPNAPAGSHPLATDWHGLATLLKERLLDPNTARNGLLLSHKYATDKTMGIERELTAAALTITAATPMPTVETILTQYFKTLPQTVSSYNTGNVYNNVNNCVTVDAYLIW